MAIQIREDSQRRASAGTELAAALARELRGDVRADAYTRHLYASDASMYAREPLLVAFPRDAADVAAAIAIAGRFDVPVVPRGGGTSLAGQSAGGRGVVLDTSRHMDAIGEIDADARRVRVGPGVVQEDLNRVAQRLGLGFGPDTSTSNRATIGGMIGNNSSGSHSIVYGTTIDHVHELEVVLADGSTATLGFDAGPDHLKDGVRDILRDHAEAIATGYPRHWRQSGGYRLDRVAREFDLAKLVTGSEGTLVAITEAEVGLVPLPEARMFAVGHFASVADAIAATGAALALEPAAVELIDRTILELSRSKHEYRALSRAIEGDPGALLFVTVFAESPEEARARLDRLDWPAYHTIVAATAAEQEALTKVRKAGLGLLMAASSGARRPLAFVEDTAVAPERLSDYVASFKEILDRHGLTAGWYGHCSVGCLHIRPFVDLTAPGGIETMRAVAEEIVDLVAAFDGVNSSEHGDGRARSEFNRRIFGDDLYEAFRKVKALFDPHNRMNPGVMVDARPMTDDLRDPALPPPGPIETHLSFPGGMRAAADRCQRIGACRKTGIGVMCPSYMATREEEHATRGRANALVKALSTPDPQAAMGDERLHEILDLCLECKACKSECPLSVDMASLKAEFLSHYQAVHGVPRRSRLFGSIRTLNRLGAATAPLSNLAPRALLERAAGIDRRRPLPRFTRKTLLSWDRRRRQADRPRAGLPRRHVHHLHRARGRPRGDRAPGGGGLRRAARARRLLRAREHLQGTARPRPRAGGRHDRAARAVRRARRADRGLRAVVPADAARGARKPAARQRPRTGRRRPGPARRGAARGGDRRRVAPARSRREGGGQPDRVPRALPPEGARGDDGDGRAARAHPGRRGRGAGRRLLRDGRVVRLRGRALRAFHADRGNPAVPGVAERGRRHPGRRDRGLMPSADRARGGSGGPSPRADRAGGAVTTSGGSHV